MRKFIFLLVGCLSSFLLRSQSRQEISVSRGVAHEKIVQAKRSVYLALVKDALNYVQKEGEPVRKPVLFSMLAGVDEMEKKIELLPSIDSAKKIKFLDGLTGVLHSYELSYKAREASPDEFSEFINAYENAIRLDMEGASLFPFVRQTKTEIGLALINCFAFNANTGFNECREYIVLKVYEKTPNRIVRVLFDHPDVSYSDSLLKIIARSQPDELYTYAQAVNSSLGKRIQKIDDPLVKLIVQLSGMAEGQRCFPFLDDLLNNKITIAEIKKAAADPQNEKYYKLLVKTQIGYAARMQQNDTPLAVHALSATLKKKAVEDFINVINGLHDSPDATRLRVIKNLNYQELYYLVVMSESEMYTSSYLKLYYKIFELFKKGDSYALLQSVHFNYFRKFIKMAANYNTLNHFMGKMNKTKGELLLRSFADDLTSSGSMEDAVDVADSYVSISDKTQRALILEEVRKKLSESSGLKNDKSVVMYRLLETLFLSLDTTQHIDISSAFGIPSVYTMKNSSLRDSSGTVIIEQFFYGDADGKKEFVNFIRAYSNKNWKITHSDEWVTISSRSGNPVTIYSNRPLDAGKDLDAKAQAHLAIYLEKNGLYPSVVIHRGHSYHVSSTIEQLPRSAKVIFLGSCGGYHNLDAVLKTCPDAQIISTKQEGSGAINEPMIIYLTSLLQSGKDLEWQGIWKSLGIKFKNNPKFKDYIPPYKNLGGLLISAYNSVTSEKK